MQNNIVVITGDMKGPSSLGQGESPLSGPLCG